MRKPVVAKFHTKESLFLKLELPILDKTTIFKHISETVVYEYLIILCDRTSGNGSDNNLTQKYNINILFVR